MNTEILMLVTFRQICAYYASSTTAKHPFFVKENQGCCTSLRDLIKDTLQRDRKRRKSSALGGNQIHDLKSLELQACALPLCYNCCPIFLSYKFHWIEDFSDILVLLESGKWQLIVHLLQDCLDRWEREGQRVLRDQQVYPERWASTFTRTKKL